MGQQYNKVQKRARRKAYIERCKERIRETIKKNSQTSKKK